MHNLKQSLFNKELKKRKEQTNDLIPNLTLSKSQS